MDARFVYDIPYVKEVLGYLLIPFLIFIIISGSVLMIYAIKHKDHEDIHYKYTMNLFTLIISTLLVASLLAILIGFALSFKKQVDAANIKSFVVYVVLVAPLLPFFSFLALLFKMIKLIKNRPNKEEKSITDSNIETISVIEEQEPISEDNISITEIPSVPTIEVTPQEEVLEADTLESLDEEVLQVREDEVAIDSLERIPKEDIETL